MATVKEKGERLLDEEGDRGKENFYHTSCPALACQTTQKAVRVVTVRMLLHPQALYLPDGGGGSDGRRRRKLKG